MSQDTSPFTRRLATNARTVEGLLERLALVLNREVDDRRRATKGRRDRAGAEIVGRDGPAERKLHVHVRVDCAGDHELAGGVDRPVRLHR